MQVPPVRCSGKKTFLENIPWSTPVDTPSAPAGQTSQLRHPLPDSAEVMPEASGRAEAFVRTARPRCSPVEPHNADWFLPRKGAS